MSVNYIIASDVVDITTDVPVPEDSFFIDSNVWFWMTYTKTSPWAINRTKEYPAFVQKALKVNSKLYRCGLSFSELASIIEKSEYDIFNKCTTATAQPNMKEFRHNFHTERSAVVAEVQAAWVQVKNMAMPMNTVVDDLLVDNAVLRFDRHPLGGYDVFYVEEMLKTRIVQIITDDGDFATVPGISVFTTNRNVISAAKTQGKLVSR
jgi:hypothetical protein